MSHDYEPSWDYPVVDLDALIAMGVTQAEHKASIERAIESAKSALLVPMGFDGCEVFFVEPQSFPRIPGADLEEPVQPLAIYCCGTSSWPVIGIDLDSIIQEFSENMLEVLVQIRTTVAHELAHAYQESCGFYDEHGFDEDDAEEFAREWADTGAINLWMLDPLALGVDRVQGFPIKTAKAVFHVGTMNPNEKGKRHTHFSFEGNGLSVSVHPKEWSRIARLGGNPTWEIRPCGRHASFLDFHLLSPQNIARITDWAVANDFLRPTRLVTIAWHDDELWPDDDLGGNFSSVHDIGTPKCLMDAQIEYNRHEKGRAKWTESQGFAATATLDRRIGFSVPLGVALDMAATCFVEDVLSSDVHIDGVWWNDDFKPEQYSAPRGVICKRSLEESEWIIQDEAKPPFAESVQPVISARPSQ